MSAQKILSRAISLWKNRKAGWCREASAKDKLGYAVDIGNPQARCFCMTGMLNKVGQKFSGDDFDDAHTVVQKECFDRFQSGIIYANDYKISSRKEAVSIFEGALRRLQKK